MPVAGNGYLRSIIAAVDASVLASVVAGLDVAQALLVSPTLASKA